MTLQKAIDARSFYRKKVATVTAENPAGGDLMDQEIASYEDDMKHMLQVSIFSCLCMRVCVSILPHGLVNVIVSTAWVLTVIFIVLQSL